MNVYLVGAGASAGKKSSYGDYRISINNIGNKQKVSQSVIPALLNLGTRIENAFYVHKYLLDKYDKNVLDKSTRTNMNTLGRNLKWLSSLLKSEPFVDILAETISRTNSKIYPDLLKTLCYYFILEQITNGVDVRYKTFITNLIAHDEKKILPNNSILFSWNYDFQFEEAIYEKFGDNYFQKFIENQITYREILSNNILKKANEFEFVKLNGSCIINKLDKKISKILLQEYMSLNNPNGIKINLTSTYDDIFDLYENQIKKIKPANAINFLSQVTKYYYDRNFNPTLGFAWDNQKSQILNNINTIFNSCKRDEQNVLIVVGYSFPYLNSQIDSAILKNYMPSKIIVQCTEDSYNGIKSRLESLVLKNGIGNKQSIKEFIEYDVYSNPDDLLEFKVPV